VVERELEHWHGRSDNAMLHVLLSRVSIEGGPVSISCKVFKQMRLF
jgi:hypothetical protein